MREYLIKLWRAITKRKALRPVMIFIRWAAATKLFNGCVDMIEVCILKKRYQESKDYFSSQKLQIAENIKCLGDEKSVAVYTSLIHYRSTHLRKYLKGIVDREQYFAPDIVKLDGDGAFIDCGAYRGDTVKVLMKKSHSMVPIICLEADPYNYKYLKNRLPFLAPRQKTEAYPFGVWSSNGDKKFTSNLEEAGRISEQGDILIRCRTIDSIVKGRKTAFIKMDIEGAELKALYGAEGVIQRDRPQLAVSIYHSDQDMVLILKYLREKYPFYQFYIRHYTWFYADTVLYAIGKEDMKCSLDKRDTPDR